MSSIFENVWAFHQKSLRMGVSVRTLHYWEQGRREPNASARTLLLVADKQPEALRKVFSH